MMRLGEDEDDEPEKAKRMTRLTDDGELEDMATDEIYTKRQYGEQR
jgi:hypothetical protein